MTDSLLSAIYDFKTLKIVRWRNGLQFSYICLDGIMKKMKCQHSQIWLTTRLAKLSLITTLMSIVRLLIYGVKTSFPKRNLNNYSLDRFKEIKCVIVNFESVFYPNLLVLIQK